MPAITVDDISILPRIAAPDPGTSRVRSVKGVTTAPKGYEGEGFPVRRAFAGVDLGRPRPVHPSRPDGRGGVRAGRAEGHAVAPAPRLRDRHLHDRRRRSSTRTRNGGGGTITNGDTQWMTAGAGILHIEKPPEWLVVSGGLFHGIQLWVNLPARPEVAAPRYQDIRAGEVALALVGRRRRAGARHRRRGRRPRRPRLDLHADDPGPRHAQPGARLSLPVATPTTTRSSTSSPATAPSGAERTPDPAPGSSPSSDRATPSRSAASPRPGEPRAQPRRAHPGRSADSRAGRVGGPVRDEHPRRGDPGLRRLPGRPARARSPLSTTPRRRSPSRSRPGIRRRHRERASPSVGG